MDMTATVVIAGLAAFSAFAPSITEAPNVDRTRLRLSLGYATAVTVGLGVVGSKTAGNAAPMAWALAVIAVEWLAYFHSLGGLL